MILQKLGSGPSFVVRPCRPASYRACSRASRSDSVAQSAMVNFDHSATSAAVISALTTNAGIPASPVACRSGGCDGDADSRCGVGGRDDSRARAFPNPRRTNYWRHMPTGWSGGYGGGLGAT